MGETYENNVSTLLRDQGRAAICMLGAIDNSFTYRVEGDQLHVLTHQEIGEEARAIIRSHKPAIISYLTTPPQIEGQCIRGHEIMWKCTPAGLWLCACYSTPATPSIIVCLPDRAASRVHANGAAGGRGNRVTSGPGDHMDNRDQKDQGQPGRVDLRNYWGALTQKERTVQPATVHRSLSEEKRNVS
jgi:hypothetical protein